MPPYKFLFEKELDYRDIKKMLTTNREVGVPYTDDQIAHAREDLEAQADPNSDGLDAMQKRYPKTQARDFDGDPQHITEGDALIAYLQMLGTLVDFKAYHADAPENRR
jgi:cytochrome c oxidase cbb3-type subunit 2